MKTTKEEIGAKAGATVFSLVIVVSTIYGADLFEALMRSAGCTVVALLLGQFLGSIWLKAAQRNSSTGSK